MKTIVIDLDGTLVESEKAWLRIFSRAYEELSHRSGISVDEIVSMIRNFRIKLIKFSDPKAFDWDYILRTISSKLNIEIDLCIEKETPYIAQKTRLANGTIETLKQLKELGLRIIIGTNGNWKYQKHVLIHHRLIDFVDEIRTSDIIGCLKNNPKFFIGADVSVGDHIVFDVHYPRTFGLKAVLVGNSKKYLATAKLLGINEIAKPSITVRSIDELPKVVHSILD